MHNHRPEILRLLREQQAHLAFLAQSVSDDPIDRDAMALHIDNAREKADAVWALIEGMGDRH